MGTSGAETLSVSANVFMGQTEAPLIVKPYVPRMTQSELLALMVGGMAHISGGMMAVYIGYGRRPGRHPDHRRDGLARAACIWRSCSCPRREQPETRGDARQLSVEKSARQRASTRPPSGASDGLRWPSTSPPC